VTTGESSTIIAAYKTDDCAAAFDGAVQTDTSCEIPSGITHLYVGCYSGYGGHLNGHIRHLTYFPRRLPNTALQALTN
jgi:hypothetical protein